MTTLQYEDNNCRQKQIQKEKDEFAIKVLEYYHNNLFYIPLKENEALRILEHIKKQIEEI